MFWNPESSAWNPESSSSLDSLTWGDKKGDCIGRLPKKRVGTLKNVISNLKRFREMDNVSEGKDTKTDSFEEGTKSPRLKPPTESKFDLISG
ncbi:hypothetical protein AC249_AIPGENE25176 [Exaiptasia diaphana]|nr:hypothetical protein AC249_AIPGENE25176 [Exaiptasia diaphana]